MWYARSNLLAGPNGDDGGKSVVTWIIGYHENFVALASCGYVDPIQLFGRFGILDRRNFHLLTVASFNRDIAGRVL